jgi:hypothetical protein
VQHCCLCYLCQLLKLLSAKAAYIYCIVVLKGALHQQCHQQQVPGLEVLPASPAAHCTCVIPGVIAIAFIADTGCFIHVQRYKQQCITLRHDSMACVRSLACRGQCVCLLPTKNAAAGYTTCCSLQLHLVHPSLQVHSMLTLAGVHAFSAAVQLVTTALHAGVGCLCLLSCLLSS